jgi:protein PhnA
VENLSNCPQCNSEYTYEDRGLFVCPECGHEWSGDEVSSEFTVKDANGNTLRNGDDITIIKDLKIKGSSATIKVGTKIKNIKLVESSDDHNIDCRLPKIGSVKITPKFVKKS